MCRKLKRAPSSTIAPGLGGGAVFGKSSPPPRHVLPPIDLTGLDQTAAQQAIEQQEHRVLRGQHRLCLGAPAKLLVDALQSVGGAQTLPLCSRKPQEAEQLVPSFLQADHHSATAQAPLAHKGLA